MDQNNNKPSLLTVIKITDKLHEASALLAQAANEMTQLPMDQNFISLAKVMADNLATTVANLETRIKFPTGEK